MSRSSGRNADALERNPQVDGKYRIDRAFTGTEIRVRVDRNRIKQVFWNLSDNALRAMPGGGVLTVSLEAAPFWVRIRFRDTGMGLDPRQTRENISSPCNPILREARAWGSPSCTRSCRRTAGASACSPKRIKGAEFTVDLPRVA